MINAVRKQMNKENDKNETIFRSYDLIRPEEKMTFKLRPKHERSCHFYKTENFQVRKQDMQSPED